MFQALIAEARIAARQSIRLYFAPLKGVVDGLKWVCRKIASGFRDR